VVLLLDDVDVIGDLHGVGDVVRRGGAADGEEARGADLEIIFSGLVDGDAEGIGVDAVGVGAVDVDACSGEAE
jgi:hypothetical protein